MKFLGVWKGSLYYSPSVTLRDNKHIFREWKSTNRTKCLYLCECNTKLNANTYEARKNIRGTPILYNIWKVDTLFKRDYMKKDIEIFRFLTCSREADENSHWQNTRENQENDYVSYWPQTLLILNITRMNSALARWFHESLHSLPNA